MLIVVGYLDSPEGEAALTSAIAEARLRDAKLLVLHSERGGPRQPEKEAIASREAIERVERRLDEEGLDYETREYVLGRAPAEDVVDVATEEGAGLIVIGLRSRSMVGKLLMGSNAQEILMSAPCPVLCVPPAAV